MKVKRLVIEEGILSIDGKRKMCPYSTNQAGSQNLCGEWCALFTTEKPANDKVIARLGCSNAYYGD